jgi:TonB family protein
VTSGVGEVQRPLRDVVVKVSYTGLGAVWVSACYVTTYVWDLAWFGVRKRHDDQRRTALDGTRQHAELSPRGEPEALVPTTHQPQSRRRQVRALLGKKGVARILKALNGIAAQQSGHHQQRARLKASFCHALHALLLTLVFAPQPLLAQPLAAENHSPAITPPRALSVDISYPEGASAAGTVILELTVDASGAVSDAQVVSGDEALRASALEQAGAFRFEPARRDGRAVAARIRIALQFTPPEPVEPVPAPLGPAPSQSARSPARAPAPSGAPLEVTVLGERGRERPGSVSLKQEDARLLPGSFGDPLRSIEAQPGVVPVVSGLPTFFIRGAPPANVGFFFDGIELPILYHAFFGPSVIHPNLIERVDFYAGAAPASLGRFAGPVVAVSPRPFSSEPHASASVRAIDAGAYAESGSAIMGCEAGSARECPPAAVRAALRYSYAGLVLSLLSDAELRYWDYQVQAKAPLGQRDSVGVLAFGAYDLFRAPQASTKSGAAISFHRLDVRWDHRLGSTGRLRVALTGGDDRSAGASDDSSVLTDRSLRLRGELDRRFSRQVALHAGLDARLDHFGLETSPRRLDYPDYSALFPTRTDAVSGGYLVLELEPVTGIAVTPSLRADVYSSGGVQALGVDPRVAATFQLSRALSVEHSLGMLHQRPNFAAQVPGAQVADLSGGLQWALLASSGVRYRFPQDISASATVFRSGYFNALDPIGAGRDFTVDRTSIDRRSTISALGLELMLTRALSKRLGGFLSYTLSRSTVSLERTSSPSGFDRTHVLQAGLSYEVARRIRLGARSVFYTGIPELNLEGSPHFESARRGRPFFRLDLRAEKRFSIGQHGYLDVVAEVLNATSTREVVRLDCGEVCRERTAGPVTLPSIGIEAGF